VAQERLHRVEPEVRVQRDRVGAPEVALGVGLGGRADVAAFDVPHHQEPVLAGQCAGLLVGVVAGPAEALEEGDVRLHAGRVPGDHRQRLAVERDDAFGRGGARRDGRRQRVEAGVEADDDRRLAREDPFGETCDEAHRAGRLARVRRGASGARLILFHASYGADPPWS
jgi:hypothetical protein